MSIYSTFVIDIYLTNLEIRAREMRHTSLSVSCKESEFINQKLATDSEKLLSCFDSLFIKAVKPCHQSKTI